METEVKKVAYNYEEPFGRETKTYYTKMEETRRYYNNWKNTLVLEGCRRF